MEIKKKLSDIYLSMASRKYFFLVASFAVLLNWAGHTFVYENSYKFLYFDMLGTFVAAVVLGSVWGIAVALLTAILLSGTTSPHFIYLAVVNITGAIYWGFLSERGVLDIFGKTGEDKFKTNMKSCFSSAVKFMLFAGIGGGLLTAVFSSVVRSFIFQDFSFDRPYSMFFAELFREVFQVADSGRIGLFTNYVADTFIEIPDKVLTAFFGIAICLTIFKFDIKTLSGEYYDEIEQKNLSWHNIMLEKFAVTEIFIFLAAGTIYLLEIKEISFKVFFDIMENISINSLRDYVFLEMIIFPLVLLVFFIVFKIVFYKDKNAEIAGINLKMKDKVYLKNMDAEIKYFLADLLCVSFIIVSVYMYILVKITGVTPIAYYKSISAAAANPGTLVWLFIMLIIFIFIDRRNNFTTELLTLNDELVKKHTVEKISESFDEQRQKLQILELSWSDNTVEFLRSARHDLINHLEKSKTGMDELLVEVYDNVVKPYSNSILESQKEMRAYVEEITSGTSGKYPLKEIEESVSAIINELKQKMSSYIKFEYSAVGDTNKKYSGINKLFFIALNNILDNSVYALQKKILDPGFKAVLGVKLSITEKELVITVYDNAGGLSKDKIAQIYKMPIASSKGNRTGEGTMIAKNFIKVLDGDIVARNIRIYGENGLETEIRVPVFFE